MIRISLITLIILCFSSLSYTESIEKSTNFSIYNEEALIRELKGKGKGKEEVLKVLGVPALD